MQVIKMVNPKTLMAIGIINADQIKSINTSSN